MPAELRTRITLLLPLPGTDWQVFFLEATLADLRSLCNRVTWSSDIRDVFYVWSHEQAEKTEAEPTVLILGDAPRPKNDLTLIGYLEILKRNCQVVFNRSPIWLTTHEVERIAAYEP